MKIERSIQDKLRRTMSYIDCIWPGRKEKLVNPDGYEGAAYIDNCLKHIGIICMITFEHIHDDDVREEIRKHALAAMKGEL